MEITDPTLLDDLGLSVAAANGSALAVNELRRRAVAERTAGIAPSAKAAMVSRARNGRPSK